MALNQSALDEIAAMLKNGNSFDLVRLAAEFVFQELAEAEATARIGAERYERTETRTSERNVHRERTLSTKAGDLTLKIPKFRQGSFFPSMLEPRRRIGLLSAPRRTRAIGGLCRELTATQTVVPGTELVLVYSVKDHR